MLDQLTLAKGVIDMAPRILAKSTAVAFLALPWVTPAASEDGLGRHPVIDGEFELQPYELPDGQGST